MKENLSLLKDLLQLRIKIKIYKHMPVVSKNVYVDELGNIDNRYNNTYHRTIRLKSIYNKTSTYIDFVVKIMFANHVRISNIRTFYTPNW